MSSFSIVGEEEHKKVNDSNIEKNNKGGVQMTISFKDERPMRSGRGGRNVARRREFRARRGPAKEEDEKMS